MKIPRHLFADCFRVHFNICSGVLGLGGSLVDRRHGSDEDFQDQVYYRVEVSCVLCAVFIMESSFNEKN